MLELALAVRMRLWKIDVIHQIPVGVSNWVCDLIQGVI